MAKNKIKDRRKKMVKNVTKKKEAEVPTAPTRLPIRILFFASFILSR